MNNKAQTIMLTFLFAIFIFLVGVVFINFLIPDVNSFRTAISCDNPSNISDGTKLTCLFGDAVIPYWILLISGLAGGAIIGRLLT